MIDEMTTPALIEFVTCDEDSTERELELADRLSRAMDEISTLVEDITRLRALNGTDT